MLDIISLFVAWSFMAIAITGVVALPVGFICCVVSDAIQARGSNAASGKHRII